jgi:hypothetical protein
MPHHGLLRCARNDVLKNDAPSFRPKRAGGPWRQNSAALRRSPENSSLHCRSVTSTDNAPRPFGTSGKHESDQHDSMKNRIAVVLLGSNVLQTYFMELIRCIEPSS